MSKDSKKSALWSIFYFLCALGLGYWGIHLEEQSEYLSAMCYFLTFMCTVFCVFFVLRLSGILKHILGIKEDENK